MFGATVHLSGKKWEIKKVAQVEHTLCYFAKTTARLFSSRHSWAKERGGRQEKREGELKMKQT